MTHLSRTYHALNFARVFVGIIYIVYNTRELTQTGNKNAKNVRINILES